MKSKGTNIEIIVGHLLSSMQLKYKKQYKIGNFKVDFYLTEYNLTIQTDGCYWHFCDKCSKKQKKIYNNQKFQKHRDKSCATFHRYKKINLLRLKECEILEDIHLIKDEILDILKEIIDPTTVKPIIKV